MQIPRSLAIMATVKQTRRFTTSNRSLATPAAFLSEQLVCVRNFDPKRRAFTQI